MANVKKQLEENVSGTSAIPETRPAGRSMERPAYLGERDLRGTEGITKDDVRMPRIRLLQKGSPECDESAGAPEFNPDLKPGMFLNSLTGVVYGKGPLEFAVIRRDRPRAMIIAPFMEGGQVLERDIPLDDPRCEWNGKAKPIATTFHDFLVVLLPQFEVIGLSFSKSNTGMAKTLNAMLLLTRDSIFKGVYQLRSIVKQKPVVYQALEVKLGGYPTLNEVGVLEVLYDQWKDKSYAIDTEETEADPDSFDPNEIERGSGDTPKM